MHYVIIGNSYAGISAVEAIREVDKEGKITIISEEKYPAYSRPLISYYLGGKVNFEQMLYRREDFYKEYKVNLILGKKVDKVIPEENTVIYEDKKIFYDRLLIATGGKPFVPYIEGQDHKNIFTFTTYQDALNIKNLVSEGKKVVIVGGGLIGLKAAEGLSSLSVDITIVELGPRILALALDDYSGAILEERLIQNKIKIITNHTVKKIVGNEANEVVEIVLDDERRISCEILIIAIGVRPNIDLVKDTPIKTNRGVLVDNFMQTSYNNVYAAGDVVEAYDMVNEKNNVIAIVPLAFEQGRIAGFNMAGLRRRYLGGLSMNSVEVFSLAIMTMGVTNPTREDQEVQIYKKDNIYRKLILYNDILIGAILVGEVNKAGILTNLIKSRKDIRNFKDKLLKGEFIDYISTNYYQAAKAQKNLL